MKTGICIAAISIAAGIALAQQPGPAPKPAGQTAPAGQAAPGGQTSPAGQTTPQADRQAPPPAGQTPAAGQAPAAAPAGAPEAKAGQVPEMKTKTYKGILVDASCAKPTGAAPAAAAAPAAEGAKAAPAAESKAECPVSATTSQMALKTDDGQTLPFDLVGNQRAQDAFKTKKKWNEAASAGKPIRVKVSGVTSGEKLIVSSIN